MFGAWAETSITVRNNKEADIVNGRYFFTVTTIRFGYTNLNKFSYIFPMG